MIDSNTLRFVSFSSSNTNFTGNDGEVFSFKIIPNINSGTYTLPITNPIISNVELGDITSDVYNGSFTINAPFLSTSVQVVDYGNIPITEVQTTNITLTNTGAASLIIDELVFDSSKLSFPLEVPTTLEVNESVTVVLEYAPIQIGSLNENISIRNNSPEEQQIINVLANVFSPNYLSISDTNVFKGNSYEIPLNLVNNENIRAIQYDLNIPEGFIFDLDNVVETSILNNFTTSISSLGNNNYRFIIYTVSNDFIISGDETILTLPIFVENTIDLGQYTFEISNVVLSSESNQNISSEALRIGYVNVESSLSISEFEKIKVNIFPNPSSGNFTVQYYLPEQEGDLLVKVYDILGRLVWNEGFEKLEGLSEIQLNLSSLKKGNYILMIGARKDYGKRFETMKRLIIK